MPDELRWYLFLLHANFALLPGNTIRWNRVKPNITQYYQEYRELTEFDLKLSVFYFGSGGVQFFIVIIRTVYSYFGDDRIFALFYICITFRSQYTERRLVLLEIQNIKSEKNLTQS